MVLLGLSAGPAAGQQPAPSSELRLLIDVSGSMKRTDPHNLRAPAMRLLVGLLPETGRAGAWEFGTRPRTLVEPGAVTPAWKSGARRAADNIHSRAQFTDIGAALEAAIADWEAEPADDGAQRNLVLLSDGMVDVPGDDAADAAERQRIIDELVPRLQAARVNVHTVALSEEADAELLELLAMRTDGAFRAVDLARELERVFLHLFEQSTPRDTLPLEGNRLKVDESVSELTLLIFRDPDADPMTIVPPDATRFGREQAAEMERVRWFSEGSHELVTIERPAAGEWLIEAEMDPDNRAMVVTDLRLQYTELPNRAFAGEQLDFSAYLSEGGDRITREAFLNLVSLELVEEVPGVAEPRSRFLKDFGLLGDRKAGDGYFDVELDEQLRPGRLALELQADSPTFERQARHEIAVEAVELLDTRLVTREAQAGSAYRVEVRPDTRYLAVEGAEVSASLVVEGGEPRALRLEREAGDVWVLETDPAHSDRPQTLELHFVGKTRMGRGIDYHAPPVSLPALASEPAEPEPGEPPSEPGVNWWFAGGIALFTGLALGVLAWWLARRWRRRQQAQLDNMTEALQS